MIFDIVAKKKYTITYKIFRYSYNIYVSCTCLFKFVWIIFAQGFALLYSYTADKVAPSGRKISICGKNCSFPTLKNLRVDPSWKEFFNVVGEVLPTQWIAMQ